MAKDTEEKRLRGKWVLPSFPSLRLTGGLRWRDIWNAVLNPEATPSQSAAIASSARQSATVVWLLGKVQSGKTSIVRALTGYTSAEIGNGYAPCTRTSRVFDFPPEAPVIRFLDTRGLGEARYDPAEDLAFCESQAHLVVVVMKALDPQQAAIVEVVRGVRSRRPSWPVIVAQTGLHEGYPPGAGHPQPYPFAEAATKAVPDDLGRALSYQRQLFSGLPGAGPVTFVPIDFTLPEDGYRPINYGLEPFVEALASAAPAGLVAALEELAHKVNDARTVRAHPHVVGYSTAAAAVDSIPLAGLIGVPGVQAKMLHSLARIYGIGWDRRTLGEFASAIGTGTVLKLLSHLGVRQISRLIPIYGQTVGAVAASAASFATTFALGKAACYFLARRRAGETDFSGVAGVYRSALAEALKLVPRPDARTHERE
jgi:uncharacterized protein (DUF697 family)